MSADEGIGCRPLAEALAIGWGLFFVGVLALFGADPATVAPVVRFVFFLGAPATTLFQFISSSDALVLAWPIDLLLWSLAAVWAGRAPDRRRWWRRMVGMVGVAAVLAAVAV